MLHGFAQDAVGDRDDIAAVDHPGFAHVRKQNHLCALHGVAFVIAQSIHERIDGDASLLVALAAGDWSDGRFFVLPPGHRSASTGDDRVLTAVPIDDEERLIVVHELDRQYRHADMDELLLQIRRAVAAEHEIEVYAVVLIRQASLPRTTSGKVQRNLCRQHYLDGELKIVAQWTHAGLELLTAGPRLQLWRAPTDNDANTWGEEKAAIRWREAGYDRLQERVEAVHAERLDAQAARIVVRSVSEPTPVSGAPRWPRWEQLIEQIVNFLNQFFDAGQVQEVAAQLHVDFAALPGAVQAEKVRALATRIDQQERIPELIQVVHRKAQEIAQRQHVPEWMLESIRRLASTPAQQLIAELKPIYRTRFENTYVYTVSGDGDIVLEHALTPSRPLPFLPRVEVRLTLPSDLETFT